MQLNLTEESDQMLQKVLNFLSGQKIFHRYSTQRRNNRLMVCFAIGLITFNVLKTIKLINLKCCFLYLLKT